jgi:transcriptional regulator with XRE-family HTH domain
MDDAGLKLKRARERLGLRFRDVEEFSQQIADRRRSSEFIIAISRLADIENRGVVPSLYKLYTLCAIYRLELADVLRWYGVDPSLLPTDAAMLAPDRTHLIGFGRENLGQLAQGEIQVPLSLDPGLDLARTTFLSRFIQSWGVLPLMLVGAHDPKNYRYAFIGQDDWFMYPAVRPGSLLLIDETRRKVVAGGWTSEAERPMYLLEHHDGWLCAWCSVTEGSLIAIPHPANGLAPRVFPYPDGVDVVGQVVGLANRLSVGVRPKIRS